MSGTEFTKDLNTTLYVTRTPATGFVQPAGVESEYRVTYSGNPSVSLLYLISANPLPETLVIKIV